MFVFSILKIENPETQAEPINNSVTKSFVRLFDTKLIPSTTLANNANGKT
jgi:hypothetical protein